MRQIQKRDLWKSLVNLNIFISIVWMFWWYIVNELSLVKKSSNFELESSYRIILKDLPWSLLILLLVDLLQNIHIRGKYLNCASKIDLKGYLGCWNIFFKIFFHKTLIFFRFRIDIQNMTFKYYIINCLFLFLKV